VLKGEIDEDDDISEELEEAVFRLLARYSSFQVGDAKLYTLNLFP